MALSPAISLGMKWLGLFFVTPAFEIEMCFPLFSSRIGARNSLVGSSEWKIRVYRRRVVGVTPDLLITLSFLLLCSSPRMQEESSYTNMALFLLFK